MAPTRTSSMSSASLGLLAALGLLALSPADGAARGGAPPPVFSNPLAITNTYAPFEPGAVKVFTGKSDGEKTTLVDLYLPTTRTFVFNGGNVECRVLQETEFEGGVISEISQNYFGQGDDGALYYFGETVDQYEDGLVVGHGGSWLVGGPTLPGDPPDTGNAPAPGLFMPAAPGVGDTFKPEDLFPLVDETDTVLNVGLTVKVAAGTFTDCIEIEETSQLGPDVERKIYAPGVGVIRGKAQGEKFALIASTLPVPR